MSEYQGFLDDAIYVAKEAGRMIKEAFDHRFKSVDFDDSTTDIKDDNDANLVTLTDQQVETFCFGYLKEKYPLHFFIGEETAATTQSLELTENPTWIIDPIDGTCNFVHGFPFCCISIGLVIDKVSVVGVIFNPIMNELYTATLGGGAYLNGSCLKRSHPKPLPPLSQSVIAIEFGNERQKELVMPKLRSFESILMKPCRAFRCIGSAALNCCFVARGIFDIYFEWGIYPWDIAAGAIILRESGCIAVNCTKSSDTDPSLNLLSRNILCVRHSSQEQDMKQRIQEMQEWIEPVPYKTC